MLPGVDKGGALACTVQWLGPMPALDRLLKRLGFVKLSRYGLVLTPEDRIVSLRPSILDDGLRGKVVGWQDDDLAAAELRPWESPVTTPVARLVAQPQEAARLVPPSRLTVPIAVAPVPLTPMVVSAAPARPAPAPAPAPAIVPAPQSVAPVAAQPMAEEDEWEWEIALARVRAAADKAEDAARNPIARAPAPARPAARPAPAPAARPTPAPAARPAVSRSSTEAASKPRPVVSSMRAAEPQPAAPRSGKTRPIATVAPAREADDRSFNSEATVEVASLAERQRLPKPAEVVELGQPKAAPPRRLAKGTSPVAQNRAAIPSVRPRPALLDETTVTELSLSEETATQLSLSNDDHTTPHLELMDQTKLGLALPSIRGRLAR